MSESDSSEMVYHAHKSDVYHRTSDCQYVDDYEEPVEKSSLSPKTARPCKCCYTESVDPETVDDAIIEEFEDGGERGVVLVIDVGDWYIGFKTKLDWFTLDELRDEAKKIIRSYSKEWLLHGGQSNYNARLVEKDDKMVYRSEKIVYGPVDADDLSGGENA